MKIVPVLGVMTLAGLLAMSAKAQQATQQEQKNVAVDCAPDLKAYCKDVKAGGGRLLSCLQTNLAKLSPSCKSALDAAHAEGNSPAARKQRP